MEKVGRLGFAKDNQIINYRIDSESTVKFEIVTKNDPLRSCLYASNFNKQAIISCMESHMSKEIPV